MGISRAEKEAEIQALNERFSSEELVVVTQYSGLSVAALTELRSNLRKEGASFKVTKNSLTKIALKGTRFEQLESMFTGPTGVATSQDPIAAARVAYKFAKENNKLIIIGGAMGDMLLDAKGVEEIAKLPSLDEIRSKLVGLLQAPAQKIASVVAAPARDLVGVTKAYSEK
ncbi:MAG: 50S ribosomal protein L10 [Zetaproteobacteria bacterium]|nr:MAG: 50S ribosomal protein L10 [Zetaproteobacteria bacterium]